MARHFIDPNTLKDDITGGLVLGNQSVPDGLAQGLLAASSIGYLAFLVYPLTVAGWEQSSILLSGLLS